MRIAPLVTLATLAAGASAARDATREKEKEKDATRQKKQSLFHRADAEDGTAKVRQSLLDSVGTRQKAERRRREERGRPSMDVMEKKTKVKRDDIAKQSLSKRRAILQGKRPQRGQAEASDGSAAAEEVPQEPQAASSELVMDRDEKPTAKANEEKTPAEDNPADISALLRQPDDKTPFEFEEWDESMASPPQADTPADVEAPEVALDPKSFQPDLKDLVQKRRKDRAADLVVKKERRAAAKNASEQSNPIQGNGRRMAKTPELRKPNPRPGRRNMTDDKVQRRAQRKAQRQKKRDLRRGRASGGKPTPPKEAYEERELKKSKKSSNSYSSSGSHSGSEYDCEVRLTNLTKEQWFSDIFWMVHSDKVELPLFEYGLPAFDDLALLAQDGDPDELIDFYEDNEDGVLDVDAEPGFLEEGDSLIFGIPMSGSYDLLTLATAFIFANDGFVALDAVDIEDGAEWYLWGIDAGVEANTQLCWTVQANCEDFPPNSECYFTKDDVCDENDNQFIGEGFVYVHSGIHDLSDKGDVEDFLSFTCDDLDANSFVEYFQEAGYDDDRLLYDDDRGRFERDDQSFLDYIDTLDDDAIIFDIARNSQDFDDFCDELDDIADFLFNAFETLEPQVFDFRTPMMRVEIQC